MNNSTNRNSLNVIDVYFMKFASSYLLRACLVEFEHLELMELSEELLSA